MESIDRMVRAHPRGQVPEPLRGLLPALMECESACVMCADACLAESDIAPLAECIALSVDCADVCATTARLAGRIGHHYRPAMRHQLEACREMCRLCAEGCDKHTLEYCRICAEICRRCERACSVVIEMAMAHS